MKEPSAGLARLTGRRVVVTGAGSGIGKATAMLFAREGASVAILDLNYESVQATAKETGGYAVQVDVSNEDSNAAAIEKAAQAMGGIDGVVNAAGIMIVGPLGEVPVSSWRRTLDVNLTGTYLTVRNCLPWLNQAPDGATICEYRIFGWLASKCSGAHCLCSLQRFRREPWSRVGC